MSINFPTNTIVIITVTMIVLDITIWVMLSEVLNRLTLAPNIKRNWRWGTAFVLTAWLLVRLALEINPPGGQLLGLAPTIGFTVFGFFVGTLPLVISPTFRQIVRATPPTWIIGIHIGRIVGGYFLTLLDMKLLPAEFALPAGYGDVTAALLAVLAIYVLAMKKPNARWIVVGWNLFGILDFVIALTTGTRFIAPFAAQLAASGTSVLYLNYVLIIPAFGVPLVGVFHIYSLYQLWSGRHATTEQGIEKPVNARVVAREQQSAHP